MQSQMRLAIVGSRLFDEPGLEDDEALAYNYIIWVLTKYQPKVVISGGARGIDTLAKATAKNMGFRVIEYMPQKSEWASYKARNKLIAADCTHLLAILHAQSTSYGAGWTADYAEKIGKIVYRKTYG